ISLILLIIGNFTNPIQAQSIFDSGFGNNGIVIPQIQSFKSGSWSVSIQSDNKIIIAGWAYIYEGSPSNVLIARFLENGEPDTAFNSTGLFTIGNSTWEDAFASTIQSDGKILVAGRYYNGRSWDFLLIRFNEDGSLDSTFAQRGYTTKDYFGKDDRAFSIDVQSDGKILICGFAENLNWDFAISRFNPDGSIDSTFGERGSTVLNIGSYNDVAFSIKAQQDGKIIVCGWTYIFGSWDFALVRLNPDGSLDNTFGSNGIVTTDYNHLYNTSHSVAIQSNGKYVAAGYTEKPGSTDTDILIIRYNTDGSIDHSFGNNGLVLIDYNNADDFAWVVKVDQYDKIVVGGNVTINGSKILEVARLNSNGSPDISFAENGIFITQIWGSNEECRDLLIQPDGKILLTGHATDGEFSRGFLIRLENPYKTIDNKKEFLSYNFPNPFNSSTKIFYFIPTYLIKQNESQVNVNIKVYDILGREIETLYDGFQQPGQYEVEFPSTKSIKELSSGVYVYRIEIDGNIQAKKMIFLR
ncbi:MAG: T9SS type A sorting domain-containing protein, partial [Ignavibacterium sp.]|uniref:T9SS type A sorting domain-containing protein n=1 Tax=Ignavibacterium sp. TaxID=2651167 RepID=UPI004049107E